MSIISGTSYCSIPTWTYCMAYRKSSELPGASTRYSGSQQDPNRFDQQTPGVSGSCVVFCSLFLHFFFEGWRLDSIGRQILRSPQWKVVQAGRPRWPEEEGNPTPEMCAFGSFPFGCLDLIQKF